MHRLGLWCRPVPVYLSTSVELRSTSLDVALSPAQTITSCEFVYVYGVNKHLVFFLSLSDVYLRSSSHELQCDPLWFGIVHV